MRISGQFDIGNYSWKVGIIQNLFVNVAVSSFIIFLCQTVWITPDQNVSILSHKNLSILLVRNMCNRNIGTFWHRKLCMKSTYNSKFLWILPIFPMQFFWPKCPDTPSSYTTLRKHPLKSVSRKRYFWEIKLLTNTCECFSQVAGKYCYILNIQNFAEIFKYFSKV